MCVMCVTYVLCVWCVTCVWCVWYVTCVWCGLNLQIKVCENVVLASQVKVLVGLHSSRGLGSWYHNWVLLLIDNIWLMLLGRPVTKYQLGCCWYKHSGHNILEMTFNFCASIIHTCFSMSQVTVGSTNFTCFFTFDSKDTIQYTMNILSSLLIIDNAPAMMQIGTI